MRGQEREEREYARFTRFYHCRAQSYSKEEFDPGSERTLAICLTHASRTLFSGQGQADLLQQEAYEKSKEGECSHAKVRLASTSKRISQ